MQLGKPERILRHLTPTTVKTLAVHFPALQNSSLSVAAFLSLDSLGHSNVCWPMELVGGGGSSLFRQSFPEVVSGFDSAALNLRKPTFFYKRQRYLRASVMQKIIKLLDETVYIMYGV